METIPTDIDAKDKETLLQNANSITQLAVSELLDGRLFVIPTYQRGYRWGKNQVTDLCNDLLEYALKKPAEGIRKSFYSLQPLIVLKENLSGRGDYSSRLLKIDTLNDWHGKDYYATIDGQQRLTTIFLLYRYLLKAQRYGSTEEAAKNTRKILFHIFYETRPQDFQVLEKIGFQALSKADIRDIDIAHAANTLYYINQWMEEVTSRPDKFHYLKGKTLSLDDVTGKLLKLLNNPADTDEPEGNVQFIWYELDPSKDAVREFLSENKGKIQLTDTEKIKALLLQRKNFGEDVKNRRQEAMAKDWDRIEMALHEPDFWAILSKDKSRENDRIQLIFKYIYDADPCDKSGYADKDDALFRYYYDRLETLRNQSDPKELKSPAETLWNEVVSVYRMLRNWYYNPLIYNLVGLLTKAGVSLGTISAIYNDPKINETEEFIAALSGQVTSSLFESSEILSTTGHQELDIQQGEEFINLFYSKKDNDKIRNILIFLNVWLLIKRINKVIEDTNEYNASKKKSDAGRSPRDINSLLYRFPFDILDSMGWDIEHIDSATSNTLENAEEQKKYIEEAEKIDMIAADVHYIQLKHNLSNATPDMEAECRTELIKRIKEIINEDSTEERKNWIGNLTLLDSGTNRSYHNKIFPLKQETIRTRVKNGVFVPICTANVFEKRFDCCTPSILQWSFDDKKAHHSFMLREIKDFMHRYPSTLIPEKTPSNND